MATYKNSYNKTNHYYIPVRFILPTSAQTLNPYSGHYVYVRAFTGLTESEAIDCHVPSGGKWVYAFTDGSTYKKHEIIDVYSPQSDGTKIFGRVEAYQPGIPQKYVKYSRKVVLCGHGEDDYDSTYSSSQDIVIDLSGLIRDKYIPYGDIAKTIWKINEFVWLPGYSSDKENEEINIHANNSADPFYSTFVTGTSTNALRRYYVTGITGGDAYRTVSQVSLTDLYLKGGDSAYTYDYCIQQFDESECPDDSCPKDGCSRVCVCDSESNCYYEHCDYDCNSHSCAFHATDVCNCFSADDDPEHLENVDISGYKDCVYTPVGCLYSSSGQNVAYIPIDAISLSAMTCRIEGQFTNSGTGSDTIFSLASASTINSGNYALFQVSGGSANAKVSVKWENNVSMAATDIPFNTDVDLTFGNNYLMDNLTDTVKYSATTCTDSTVLGKNFRLIRLCLSHFRYYRCRIYIGGELMHDYTPYIAGDCKMGSLSATTRYGFMDSFTGRFYPLRSRTNTFSCIPSCREPMNEQVGWISENASLTFPVQNTLTSSAITFRLEGQFLDFNNYEAICGYKDTYTNGNNRRILFISSGGTTTQGWKRFMFNYTRSYSSYYGYLSGITTNTDVDLTFSLGKIVNNLDGGAMVWTGSTYIASTYQSVVNGFMLNTYHLKVYRFRVYANGTLCYDGVPYVQTVNGVLTPGLYDNVTNTFVGDVRLNWDGKDAYFNCEGTNTFLLKLINVNTVFYQQNYEYGGTIDISSLGNPTAEGRTFTGWLPEIPSTMPDEDFTSYAQYSYNQYSVYYYLDGSLYTTQVYTYGDTIIEPPEPSAPSGYVFSGWNNHYTTMPATDINVFGTMDVYVPKYTINFYSGSTTWGSTPSCKKFKSSEYASGATISYPSVTGTCRTAAYGGWKLACTGGTNAPTTMPAGNLDVFYVLGYQTYTIYWRAKVDSASTYTTYSTQVAEFGDTISSGPDLSSYTPSGYEWEGWGNKSSFSMPCSDKYVDSLFIPTGATYYTINFYADGYLYDYSSFPEGSAISYPTMPSTSGGCSVSWTSWSGATVMPSHDTSGFTTSTKASYLLTYYLNGSQYAQDSHVCGSNVTMRSLPSQIGYTFTSWNPTVSTMPNNNVSAFTTSNAVTYHIYYYKNGSLWATDDYSYGQSISVRDIPLETGKVYTAWDPSLPSTMPANNISTYTTSGSVEYTAYWYKCNTSGSTSCALFYSARTAVGSTVVAPDPGTIPTGQAWSGWTSYPSTMPSNDIMMTGWTVPVLYYVKYYVDGVSSGSTDSYYYMNTVMQRALPSGSYSDWLFNPSLISGSKMPASNVSATTFETLCSADCEIDLCSKDFSCTMDADGGNQMSFTWFYSCINTTSLYAVKWELIFRVNGSMIDTVTTQVTSPGYNYSTGGQFTISYPSSYEGDFAVMTCYAYVKPTSGNAWSGPYSVDLDTTSMQLVNDSITGSVSSTFNYDGGM